MPPNGVDDDGDWLSLLGVTSFAAIDLCGK